MRVERAARRSPRLVRVTLAGAELEGLVVEQPAASVRLLLPPPGSTELVMPMWNGNEFLLPDGARPPIRTFTPRRVDPERRELDIEVVDHGAGVASAWAGRATRGDEAAVSGPGRGYVVDEDATAFLLVGDETAVPAISQLLEQLSPSATVRVHVEIADPTGRLDLPGHPGASVVWHDLPAGAPPGDAMADAVRTTEIGPDELVWVAGEAAAVQRIRRHLFDDRRLSRRQATVRGYWKAGRAGDDEGDGD